MTRQSTNSSGAFELLALLLLAVAGWFSYGHFAGERRRFETSVARLCEATGLADEIRLLRQKPSRVAALSQSARSLAQSVEQAAASVDVERQSIVRIEPQTPRRAGDTDYLEHATTVQLEGVTLRQTAALLAKLHAGLTGPEQLHCTAIRVSAPYDAADSAGDAEVWNVELTLTYLVYSSKQSASS